MPVLDCTRHKVRENAYDQAAVVSKSSPATFDTVFIQRSWCVFANAFATSVQIMGSLGKASLLGYSGVMRKAFELLEYVYSRTAQQAEQRHSTKSRNFKI